MSAPEAICSTSRRRAGSEAVPPKLRAQEAMALPMCTLNATCFPQIQTRLRSLCGFVPVMVRKGKQLPRELLVMSKFGCELGQNSCFSCLPIVIQSPGCSFVLLIGRRPQFHRVLKEQGLRVVPRKVAYAFV